MTDDEPLRAYVREAMKRAGLLKWKIERAEVTAQEDFRIALTAARLASEGTADDRDLWKASEAVCDAQYDKLLARNAELVEAIRRFLPRNLNLANGNVPDDTTIPLDVTMGELRALATLSTGEA